MSTAAQSTAAALTRAGLTVVTAESCTGGGLAAALTDLAGSSRYFERGYVTYSNLAKQQALGVLPQTLDRHGAVSAEVVREMTAGALAASGADLAIAVSGIAGPDGATPGKPVGLVYMAMQRRGHPARVERHEFGGDRAAVRHAAVLRGLEMLQEAAGRHD